MADVVPSASGTSVSNFVAALREIYGDAWVNAGLERLDAETRIQVEQAAALMWVPLEVLRRSVDAWAEANDVSADEITRRGVQLSVKRSFKTVWRILMTVTTDSALIARAPLLWSKARNVGKIHAERRAGRNARLTLTEYPRCSERQIYSLAVALEALFELTGRKRAACKFRRTLDGAVFDVAWGEGHETSDALKDEAKAEKH
jgi:hypothetical protein